MIWIFRRKAKTQCTKFYAKMKLRKTYLPLILSFWNTSMNIVKEIYSRTILLKQKLLLLCGDIEANPGPYNTGIIGERECSERDTYRGNTIENQGCLFVYIIWTYVCHFVL